MMTAHVLLTGNLYIARLSNALRRRASRLSARRSESETAMQSNGGAYVVAGAGGYWHLHKMAKFKGAKVTPPFRQADDPTVVLENDVDDTHGFMRVEIEGDLITARYFAVARPHEPPETPPRVADLFQL